MAMVVSRNDFCDRVSLVAGRIIQRMLESKSGTITYGISKDLDIHRVLKIVDNYFEEQCEFVVVPLEYGFELKAKTPTNVHLSIWGDDLSDP